MTDLNIRIDGVDYLVYYMHRGYKVEFHSRMFGFIGVWHIDPNKVFFTNSRDKYECDAFSVDEAAEVLVKYHISLKEKYNGFQG